MRVYLSRVPRSLIAAVLIALALTPLAPDTGSSVSAQSPIPHRIDVAHQLSAANQVLASFR